MKKKIKKFIVIRDNQEKKNYWNFPVSELCGGTISQHLVTGDYTLGGYEDLVIIERKGKISEWSHNIIEQRFENELDRLSKFPHPFIVCEFEYKDIVSFPFSSDIPPRYWKNLKITAQYIQKKTIEFQLQYPNIHIIFAGQNGKQVAGAIFKRVIEKYDDRQ